MKACIRCLIHALPLAVAVALISFNLSWHKFKSQISSEVVVALQFIAKSHELLMVSSLSEAFFWYVRQELASESGMPFGAAFVGFQVKLSYFWSPDLWGSLASTSFGWGFKARLISAITFTAFLVMTVGPASATCMIPRNGLWPQSHASKDRTYLAVSTTEDKMYPIKLTTRLYYDSSHFKRDGNQIITCFSSNGSLIDGKSANGMEADFTLPCPYSQSGHTDPLFSIGPLLTQFTGGGQPSSLPDSLSNALPDGLPGSTSATWLGSDVPSTLYLHSEAPYDDINVATVATSTQNQALSRQAQVGYYYEVL